MSDHSRHAIRVERIPYDRVMLDRLLADRPDATVFHTPGWLEFLISSQGVEPVLARIHDPRGVRGAFVGGVVRRYGFRLLGSPLRGWGTLYMGPVLEPDVDHTAVAHALAMFAFHDLGCMHYEFVDRRSDPLDLARAGFEVEHARTFVTDIGRSDEAILHDMRSTTRNYIRQAVRKGLTVEIAEDRSFADDFYPLLKETFARQGLAPTYPAERVTQLINALESTESVLPIRVRDAQGAVVATSISVGSGDTAVLWGAAFDRAAADLHPNEYMHWEAIRLWRDRGIRRYDMGGGGEYKAKYGGVEADVPIAFLSRYRAIGVGRTAVRAAYRARQIALGRLGRP